MVWCTVYFDILNRLGVTDECDRQMDARTDILLANAARNYAVRPIKWVFGVAWNAFSSSLERYKHRKHKIVTT